MSRNSSYSKTRVLYLSLHDSLLESWSRHSLSSWVLILRPNCRPVRRLRDSSVLCILHTLLQSFTLVRRLDWKLIGLGNIGNLFRLVRVVDLLLIVRGKGVASSCRNLNPPGELPYGSRSYGWQHCVGVIFNCLLEVKQGLSLLRFPLNTDD